MKRLLIIFMLVACDKKESAVTISPPVITTASASSAPGGGGALIEGAVRGKPTERVKFDAAEIMVPPGKSNLHVQWAVPDGTAINDDAPFTVRWGSSDGLVAPPTDIKGHGKDVRGGFDVPIELMTGASGGQLAGDVDLVVCDTETHAVCVPIKRRLELTFAPSKGNAKGNVTLPLPRAKPQG